MSNKLWVALTATCVTIAASFPSAHADTIRNGFSTERLGRLDALLEGYVNDERIGGIVALVLRDGKPVYERAVGWRDKEAGERMTVDTMFRIASQTKALTSVAILQLIEEGKLTASERAGKWIPSFERTTVLSRSDYVTTTANAKRPITIRDLITHTAGISYGQELELAPLYEPKGLGPAAGWGWYFADKDEPICTTMDRLGSLPFKQQPGERYVYGYSTDVLGCIVEKASGLPLDEYLRTRITGPLGMTDTYFYLPAEKAHRLAVVYGSGPGGKIVKAPEGSRGQGHYVEGPRKSFSGGAGLVSTARDYAAFLEALRNGGARGKVRILAPHTVMAMTTNQVGDIKDPRGLGFGFGFETRDKFGVNTLGSVGSWGWGGAYGTYYLVDPEERLTLVLMLQMMPNETDVREKFDIAVYQALVN